MEMSSSSTLMELPKVMDTSQGKNTKKQTTDNEVCISFPTMLEQKQVPVQLLDTCEKDLGETKGKILQSLMVGLENKVVNALNFKEDKVEMATVGAEAVNSATSISGFLKSLVLVESEEKITPTNENTNTNTPAPVASDLLGSITLVPDSVTENTPGTTIAPTSENIETLKAAASQLVTTLPAKASEVSQQLPAKLKQSITSGNTARDISKTLFQSNENKTVHALVSEKAVPIIKDVVLASSKPVASTYSVPGNLGKRDLQTSITEGTTTEQPEEAAPIKTQLETNSALPKASLLVNAPVLPSLSNETITTTETESKKVAKNIQAEAPTTMENFTVPMEIATSTSRQTVMKGSGTTTQPTITAEIRHQVMEHLASRLEGPVGNEKVTLYLNPERLGQIEVQITAKNDALTVVLTVPEGQVEKAIHDSVKDLTESLLARGGRFQQVDVKIESKSAQNEREQQRDNASKEKESKDQKGSPQDQEQQQAPREHAWASAMQEG